MSTVVVIQRLHKSKNIEIKVVVDDDGIFITMRLAEYIAYLADMIGNPTMIVTKGQLLGKLLSASAQINQLMKETSVYNKPTQIGPGAV
jgi:hypothetical protein